MKRFYKEVTIADAPPGWRVLLDGRGIKTAAGAAQIVPTQALAQALAAEWHGQAEEIDQAHFILRDMADYAIDIAEPDRAAAINSLLRFAETDTLCYRAEPDEALYARQAELWEPMLTWAEQRWDMHFTRISGVIHQAQPMATLSRLHAVLETHSGFTLAALRNLASLSASLVVALAALEPDANPDHLWSLANLEEDWQADLWGKDAEAEALRSRRLASFTEAMHFASLARSGTIK